MVETPKFGLQIKCYQKANVLLTKNLLIAHLCQCTYDYSLNTRVWGHPHKKMRSYPCCGVAGQKNVYAKW